MAKLIPHSDYQHLVATETPFVEEAKRPCEVNAPESRLVIRGEEIACERHYIPFGEWVVKRGDFLLPSKGKFRLTPEQVTKIWRENKTIEGRKAAANALWEEWNKDHGKNIK